MVTAICSSATRGEEVYTVHELYIIVVIIYISLVRSTLNCCMHIIIHVIIKVARISSSPNGDCDIGILYIGSNFDTSLIMHTCSYLRSSNRYDFKQ